MYSRAYETKPGAESPRSALRDDSVGFQPMGTAVATNVAAGFGGNGYGSSASCELHHNARPTQHYSPRSLFLSSRYKMFRATTRSSRMSRTNTTVARRNIIPSRTCSSLTTRVSFALLGQPMPESAVTNCWSMRNRTSCSARMCCIRI